MRLIDAILAIINKPQHDLVLVSVEYPAGDLPDLVCLAVKFGGIVMFRHELQPHWGCIPTPNGAATVKTEQAPVAGVQQYLTLHDHHDGAMTDVHLP